MITKTIRGVLAVLLVSLATASSGYQAGAPVPKAHPVTPADLQKLRWIEGTWRGTGGGVAPFIERYRFDGNGLTVETLEDGKVVRSTRYEVEGGRLAGGSESSRRVATALDDASVTFSFLAAARGSFRWERVSADSWRAILKWPAANDRPAGERVYSMDRLR